MWNVACGTLLSRRSFLCRENISRNTLLSKAFLPTMFSRRSFWGVGRTFRGTGTWVVGRKGEGRKTTPKCTQSTLNMSQHGTKMMQNGTPNRSKSSPGALLPPLGPPRAPRGVPDAILGALGSPCGRHVVSCGHPGGGPRGSQRLQGLRLIDFGCHFDSFWVHFGAL